MEVIGIIDYLVGFAIVAGIYAIFTLGLNVHWGFTGLFNIGVAGFFALGAYTSALLTTSPPDEAFFEDFKFGGNWANLGYLDWGVDAWFVFGLAFAAVCCGVIALIIGYVTLRLRDDYLAIATLGIAETVRLVFLNEKWLANGSKGLYRIPKFLGDWIAPDMYNYLYVVVVVIVLAGLYFAVQRAVNSPWGRVLRAIREDETAAEASGKDVFRFKLQSFILGAMIMGCGRRALRAPHPLSLPSDLRTAAGHVRHLGHADGGRVCQQPGRDSRRVRGVGDLDRHTVFARCAGRSKLPPLHGRCAHRGGYPAASRRHPRGTTPRCETNGAGYRHSRTARAAERRHMKNAGTRRINSPRPGETDRYCSSVVCPGLNYLPRLARSTGTWRSDTISPPSIFQISM